MDQVHPTPAATRSRYSATASTIRVHSFNLTKASHRLQPPPSFRERVIHPPDSLMAAVSSASHKTTWSEALLDIVRLVPHVFLQNGDRSSTLSS